MTKPPWNGTGKPFFNAWRLGLIGIFALSVLVYLPAIHGKPVWEDVELISGDGTGGTTLLGAFTHSFLASYYRPLTSASFVFDRLFADETTYYFHLTNILLHAFTAVLLSYLTLLITRRRVAGIAAGVFFAVQPAQLGAAAWIGGRTDVLSILFIVAFLTALVLYHKTAKTWWLAASAFAFLIAVLTKEQSFALLPAVPLSFFVFGSKKWREALALTVPFLLSGVVLFALSRLPGKPYFARGDFDSVQVPILTAADYGASFLVPTHASQLTFSLNPIWNIGWLLVGVAVIGAAVFLGMLLWKRSRPLAWVYFCAILLYVPVSNLVPVPSFWVAPYRMAETGLCAACLAGALTAFVVRKRRWVMGLVLTANLAACFYVTGIGTKDWSSGPRLNAEILEQDPHFIQSQIYTIDELAFRNDAAGALSEGNDLLSWLFGTPDWLSVINSSDLPAAQTVLVERLHTNFGKPTPELVAKIFSRQVQLLQAVGRRADAVAATREGLLFAGDDPDLNYQYGCQILATDRKEAIRRWEQTISLAPKNAACAALLGHEILKDGRYQEAADLLQRAADEMPAWGPAWLSLADARTGLGDYRGALQALDTASKENGDPNGIAERRTKIRSLMAHSRFAKLP